MSETHVHDETIEPKIYKEDGGDRQVVAEDGELLIKEGGKLTLESGAVVNDGEDAYVVVPPDDVTLEIDNDNGLQVKDEGIDTAQLADGAVTVDKLSGLAVLSALAISSAAFEHDGGKQDLLIVDGDDDRAVLVVAYIKTTLEKAAEFSIVANTDVPTEVVAVPTDAAAGDSYVGALNLPSGKKIEVDPTTGESATGEIIVTVFALKDAVGGD